MRETLRAGIQLTSMSALLLAAATACGSGSTSATPTTSPAPARTATSAPQTVPPSASVVAPPASTAISNELTPLPTTTSIAENSTPDAQLPDVTLADSGGTIRMRVGQSFLLNLGTEGRLVTIADQNVVSRLINIAVVRGAQGVYKALGPGQTTLDALGPSLCPTATPAYSAPQRVFRVIIAVDPPDSGAVSDRTR